MRYPLDTQAYEPDPRSQVLTKDIANGNYVFVRDVSGELHVLPDGIHLHPKILGRGAPATYAGDMIILNGMVTDLTNCSGTFQFEDRDGLREVAAEIRALSLAVATHGVRYFPTAGGPIEVLE